MYKYFFVVWISILNLNACEFTCGVMIQDPKIIELFATAATLYQDDSVTSATIENFYEQYICLLASRDTRDSAPLNDNGIIEHLNFLISEKESAERK